ncbi:MAG: efflux RND transporter periplasmic adaptor subunit, partial [Pseudomonadota bacterium]
MRFLPFFTACLVAVVLYAVILEREALQAFANGPEATADAAAAETGLDSDTVTTALADGPVSVVVKISEAQIVEDGLILSGRTEAARKVEVRSETSGLVISEPLKKGASVSAGDLMCQLDPGTREATLAEAEAKLIEAESDNETATKLAERGFQSENSTISSRANLQSMQAMVSQAMKEIERLEIRAPFDGILESDTAELGSLLQPGAACGTLIAL